MNDKRMQWVDALKAFGITMIILGHLLNGYGPVWKIVYGFHVPLFIFLSGITAHTRDNEKLHRYLIRKAKSILLPYYLWGIISIILYVILGSKFDGSKAITLSESIKGLLWGNAENGLMRWNAPMWYLPVFFVIQILGYFIIKIGINRIKIICCLISTLGIAILLYHFEMITYLPFGIETALYLLPFYICGVVYRKYLENRHITNEVKYLIIDILLICIGLIIILMQKNIDYICDQYRIYILFFIAAIMISVGLSGLFSKNPQYHSLVLRIGKDTLGILIIQRFPITFFEKICPGLKDLYKNSQGVGSVLITILVLVLCYCVTELILKIGPWMLGQVKKE